MPQLPQLPQLLEPIDAYALWADSYPPNAHNAVMLAEERVMLSLLPKQLNGLRVLDVGCGTGRYLRHALERGARDVLGFDLSHAMLTYALQLRQPVMQSSTTQVPMRSEAVEVIICALTLGHVESLTLALTELGRVLRPNGLLVCSDFHPVGASFGWQRTFKHNGQRLAVRHYTHTVDDWQAACADARLIIDQRVDAYINLADVPAGANYDPRAIEFPVAHTFALRKPKI